MANALDKYRAVLKAITDNDGCRNYQNQIDLLQVIQNMSYEFDFTENLEVRDYAFKWCAYNRNYISKMAAETHDDKYNEMYWTVMLFEAQNRNLDAYYLYVEHNRDRSAQFYLPRRKLFLKHGITQALQAALDKKIELLAISMPPGTGKLLADDTPVLTTEGWKRHGDLCVGDYVFGADGQPKRVLKVFPKDLADCKITFSNGEEIVCHENHEWLIYDRARGEERIIETKSLFNRHIEVGEGEKRGHRYTLQLPSRSPIDREDVTLPVKPYTFGAWLGDGRNTNPDICGDKNDYPIVESIVADGYPIAWQTTHKTTGVKYYGFKNLRLGLQEMGLCHSRRRVEKHIPEVYLTASKRQRLELLAGLLDTDGVARKSEHKYSFTTAEKGLKDTFVQLVSTFGWRACVVEVEPHLSSSGIQGKHTYWVVSFSPTEPIPCRLERKRLDVFSKQRRIAVKSIERITPVQGNCIQVQDGLYCVGETMLVTHNSTAGIYLLSAVMGYEPEKPNLASGFSGMLTRSFYDGVSQILTNKEDYCWSEIFPQVAFNRNKDLNSKEQTINVGLPKRFKSLTCRPINASLTGATRTENLLYADDLCSGIEEALSKERLDKLWQTYVTDLASRKKMGVTEIHIQTRWSVNDVVGRLEREFEGKKGSKAVFINVPALDAYGLSNFEYDGDVGFSTKFYRSMQTRYAGDRASWDALYMGKPVEREGYLYHPDEFRRFYDLPTEEPDAILGICDTKDRGKDYMFLPIFYQYGDNYYLADLAYTDHDVDVCKRFAADIIVKHNPQMVQFESNSAGGVIADEVQEAVKEQGARTKILKKFTTANKETKIIVNAPWIREHVLLLDASKYTPESYYGRAMAALFSYNVSGKNAHDDVPDGMAMFAEFCGNKKEPKQSRIIQSPF